MKKLLLACVVAVGLVQPVSADMQEVMSDVYKMYLYDVINDLSTRCAAVRQMYYTRAQHQSTIQQYRLCSKPLLKFSDNKDKKSFVGFKAANRE